MKNYNKLRKILFVFAMVLIIASLPMTVSAKKTTNKKNNLLKNGSFEEFTEKNGKKYPKYWKDSDSKNPVWAVVPNSDEGINKDSYTGGKDVFDGDYIIWPSLHSCEKATLSQTVDISKIGNGKVLKLSALLCNYNQPPNDEAILRIELLDKKGRVLKSAQASQRNPKWVRQVVNIVKEKGAVKARVKLIANRFVGSDNDAYFDDVRLEVKGSSADAFTLKGNKNAKAGKTDQLTVYKGKKKMKATDYSWSSSYEAYATVNKKGKVTFTKDYNAKVGVTIYAINKKSGYVASFEYGKKAKN